MNNLNPINSYNYYYGNTNIILLVLLLFFLLFTYSMIGSTNCNNYIKVNKKNDEEQFKSIDNNKYLYIPNNNIYQLSSYMN